MQQLAARVAETGAAGAILAGLYTEVIDGQPVPWSAGSARELRTLFDGLTDFEDMGRLQSELVVALPRFFPGVVRSWESSVTSSASSDTTPPSISEASRNAEDPPMTSESSAASSAA